MKGENYLFDTHALIFWNTQMGMSEALIRFLDKQDRMGTLYLSTISFWEIALLVKKGKLGVRDVHAWKNELINHTNIGVIEPLASEMIDSALLTDHHKDPFDRLLIAQAKQRNLILITQDRNIYKYDVKHFWM